MRKALAALAAISMAGCSAPPNDEVVESREQPIVGGVETPACAWPTTVSFSMNGNGCTATLIHPKMITVADHCLEGNGGTIDLTDSLNGRAPRTIQIDRCIPRPAGVNGGEDFAVCLLKEEVTDVPVIPVLFGCETAILKPGQEVALVGFGFIGENTQNPNGHKRWVTAHVNRINSGMKSIDIGDPMHQNCFGDSGGPAFVKLADGTWRVFGVTSTTNTPACASQGTWALTPTYVPWVEQQTGLDITPCHNAATGAWEGGPTCQGFPMNPEVALGTWANGCTENLMRSGPGMTCGAGSDAGPPVRDAQADTGRDASGGAGGRGAGTGGAGGGGRGGTGGSSGETGTGGGSGGSGGGTGGVGAGGSAGASMAGSGGSGGAGMMAGAAGNGSGGGGAGGMGPSTTVTTGTGPLPPKDGTPDSPGCSCSFAGRESHGERFAIGLLVAGGIALRRRQRRRA